MPTPNTHAWADYAVDLYVRGMATARPGCRPVSSGLRIMGTTRLVETLAMEFGDEAGSWTTAMGRRAMTLARPGPRGPDGISFTPEGFDALHQVASARMGLAMAVGDASGLSPAEAALVAECVRTKRTGMVPGEAEALARLVAESGTPAHARAGVPVPPTFGFGFAWARRSGAAAVATAGRGYARMVETSAREVPVACRLGTPEGGFLEVRGDGQGFLRPVTSPGTWDPVDVATFLEAAWNGSRWADNPFFPARRDLPVLTLAETASSGRDGTPSRGAAAALVASVGTLVAIDGIVHRRCTAPEACVTRNRRRGPAAVTWRIPGQVEATDDMGCLRLGQHEVLRLDPMDATGAAFHAGTGHARLATLPLTEAATLSAMVSEILGGEVGVVPPGGPGGFEVTTPGAWPHDPARSLAGLAAWAAAVPGEYRDDAWAESSAALEVAMAGWRREGRIELPDTAAAEVALSVHAPMAATWGRMLRELAEGPALEDAALAGFAP